MHVLGNWKILNMKTYGSIPNTVGIALAYSQPHVKYESEDLDSTEALSLS